MYNANSDIKLKTSMIRSNLCDYSDTYIHVKATIIVQNTVAAAVPVNNTNKKVIFKNCAPFTNCISEINNRQVDDARDIDILMPMYNLIEYSDVYSNTSESLWQSALDNSNNIIDFPANINNSISLKFKQQITGQTGNGGKKDDEIMVPINYLHNFWRTIEMSLINCKINLELKWFEKYILLVAGTAANQVPESQITDTKLYVQVVTLSTRDNVDLLKQLQFYFKRTIRININPKRQSKQ